MVGLFGRLLGGWEVGLVIVFNFLNFWQYKFNFCYLILKDIWNGKRMVWTLIWVLYSHCLIFTVKLQQILTLLPKLVFLIWPFWNPKVCFSDISKVDFELFKIVIGLVLSLNDYFLVVCSPRKVDIWALKLKILCKISVLEESYLDQFLGRKTRFANVLIYYCAVQKLFRY